MSVAMPEREPEWLEKLLREIADNVDLEFPEEI